MSRVLGRAEALHLRLFVEGVELPVIGALVSASEGSPATAQVEVVPASSALHLAARSKILLFFLDAANAERAAATASAQLRAAEDFDEGLIRSLKTEKRLLAASGYKLLFSGELFSVSYSKTGYGTRSLVLQCLDDSNNWDTSYLYMLRYSKDAQQGVVAGSPKNFLGLNDNANKFDDILSKPEDVIRTVALRNQAIMPGLAGAQGLVAGLFSILELLGGVQGKFIGVTAWHTIQEARVRLLDQIASDSGTTSTNLFNMSVFDEWLTGAVGDAGTVISFREIIDLINKFIYYTVAPNPVGVYRPGSRTPPDWPANVISSSATPVPVGKFATDFEKWPELILTELRKKWKGEDGGLPEARLGRGTVSPASQKAATAGSTRAAEDPLASAHVWGYATDFDLEGGLTGKFGFAYKTEGKIDGTLHEKLIYWSGKLAGKAQSSAQLYTQALNADGSPVFNADDKALIALLVDYWKDIGRAVETVGKGVLEWGGRWTNNTTDTWMPLVGLSKGDPLHVNLKGWEDRPEVKAGKQAAAAGVLAAFYKDLPARERLFTQFFRPDVWFVPPPACNVVFPEEVSSLEFSRDMMRETTRLQLATFNTVLGDDVILNQTYFAPQIEDTKGLSSGGLGTAATAFIFPHEKFSGIIPKMEKKSDVAFYARLDESQQITDEQASKFSDAEKAKWAENQIELWAERTAAFNYLSYRYDARRLSVSMKFTPRIVVGFPALVIDRTAPEDIPLDERAGSTLSPNHFLGMVRSVTHSLTQSGGTTSMSMSHARTHKSDMDDLFSSSVYDNKGLLSVQVVTSGETPFTVPVSDSLDSEEFKFLSAVKEFVEKGGNRNDPAGLRGPQGRRIKPPLIIEDADPGVVGTAPVPAGSAGPEQQDTFPFKKVSGKEYEKETYIPLEEAIRPPWISDEYSNESIGALYTTLLGCKAVTDLYEVAARPGFSSAGLADVVEKVVDQYSKVSDGGYLGASFVDELTQRDFATLEEVAEGFFSESYGAVEGLTGPMFEWMLGKDADKPVTQQLSPDEKQQVDPKLDPRKGRWEKAKACQDELLRATGLRG